jgi:hypothetical protein
VITVLVATVDTLEVSFRGELTDERYGELEEAKKQAACSEIPQRVKVANLTFFVQAQGMKPYRFLLKSDDLHLRATAARHLPTVSARASALGLAAYGHHALYDMARACAADLGAPEEVGVSRLDLAVDFQGWTPTVEEVSSIVCPAVFRPIYPSIAHMESVQFGTGDTVARLYNKTRELVVSGKGWVKETWAAHPAFRQDEDVWRFEIQLRRETLRALGCVTAQDAFERLAGLLAYGMDWCSLRVPTGLSSDRWPEDERWAAIRRGAHFEGRQLVEYLKREASVGSFEKLLPMLVGILASMAARVGVGDLDVTLGLVERILPNYLEERGQDFRRIVQDRTAKLAGH